MIARAGAYPAYRDSGVTWLGEVPRHWEVRPAFAGFREVLERNTGLRESTVLSLSYGRIVVRPVEKLHGLVPSSFETYQLVDPGDIIIRSTDLQNDQTSLRVGFARDRGIITSAYMRLQATQLVVPEFGYQLLNAYDLMKVFYGYGSGLRQNLDFADLKRMPIPLPPPDEQAAIVRYLDHYDRRIQRAIRAKQRLIGLLNEQKQAIIQRAVTRGLDPDVPMRDSGVEWLGEVPAGWEVRALKRRWSVVDCKHLTVPFTVEGYPLASVREAQRFEMELGAAKRTTAEWFGHLVDGNRQPRRGDIIYCRNVSVGAAAFVGTDQPFAMGQDVCLIRSETEDQRFLNYFLHSPAMARQLSLVLVGSTFKRINVSEVKSLIVPIPPPAEQHRISAWLDSQMERLGSPARDFEASIALLREYRARLIADVVTGRVDVRAAAAGLGEEEAPEVVDGDEDLEAAADLDEFEA